MMKGMKFSFKRLFGIKQSNTISGTSASSKASNGPHTATTLERLRDMEDLLQRKQTHLETRVEELISEARKFGKKNKRAALMALRRKKRLEEELTKIDGTLTTIELQREALESAKNNVQVLGALQDAAHAIKTAQKFVSVDKVLDIMDEVNEQQELAKEISDAIANPLARMDSSMEDAELEKELEELEQEELNQALLQVNVNGVELPSSPPPAEKPHAPAQKEAVDVSVANHSPQQKEKPISQSVMIDPDEKELQELAQWST